MAAVSTPNPREWTARYRTDREEQVRRDREFARRLQEQEEEFLRAASIRSANERRASSPQVPFVPPVVLSEHGSDEWEEDGSGQSPPNSSATPSPPRVLDRNGAYTPEPYHRRFPSRPSAPVIPPVVPSSPLLDRNGAYTPVIPPAPRTAPVRDRHEPSRPSQPPQSAPFIPPVIPSPPVVDRNGAYTPVIPPAARTAPVRDRPSQPPQSVPVIPPVVPSPPVLDRNLRPSQPRPTVPFIPPVVPDLHPYRPVLNTSSRRAATPVPPRPTYWYPPGVVPHHLRAQTPVPTARPAYFYPQQQPPGTVVPAPPIPPIVRQRRPSVANDPPPKQTEEVIVPFIPPMPDEKPSPKSAPRPILKPKPPSTQKSTKAGVSFDNDDPETFKNTVTNASTKVPRPRHDGLLTQVPAQPPPEPKAKVEATKSPETSESNTIVEEDEITENDADLESGPLYDLRKHVSLLTGSFKCSVCSAMVHPKPIHKYPSISSPSLPSLDSHLHLTCSDCRTMYCRGCLHVSNCKRTCTAGPDEKKCLLKTCCRAGRAIAIFAILSCFDAKFLAMVSASPHSTYFEYIKQTLSFSSTSSLSTLLLVTIKSLLPWLPVDPIHSKSPPHVHASVEPLFRVSLLLEVIRVYLRAPRERWIRPGNGVVYEQILMFLRRLEQVGKGAIAGLVLKPGRGIDRTRGVGEVVWALADRANEKNKGNGNGKRRLGWIGGNAHESFSEVLGKKKLRQDLQDMKDKIQEDQEEKKALLDQFLGQLLRWSMADVLKN